MANQNLLPELEDQNLLPELNQNLLPELEDSNLLPELDQNLLPELEDSNLLPELGQNLLPELGGEQASNISGDPRDEGFGSVLSRTIDELQASSWAGVRVLGEAFNSEALIDMGDRGVAVNDRQIAKRGRPLIAEEVEDLGDAMTFIKQGIAQILPSVAVSMPTAVGGAKAGALAAAAIPVPGARIAGGLIGGALGAFLPSFVMSAGEIDREMKARAGDDYEAPGAAMTGGAVVAALDVASIAFGLKPLMPVLLKKTTLKKMTDELIKEGVEKSVAQAAVAQALKASLIEGTTESSQEFVEDLTAGLSTGVSSEEGQLQSALLNAFLLGSIGGGTLGSVSGAISQYGVNQRKKSEREVEEQMKKIQESVDQQVNIAGETWQDLSPVQLREEAKKRGLKTTKKESNESIIKKLTDFEVFNRRAQMEENYFYENFGALSAKEKIKRGKRREDLRLLVEEEDGVRKLKAVAEEMVQTDPFGGPDIPLIPTLDRTMSTDELINKILDVELMESRALSGGASIIFGASQEKKYIAKEKFLAEQSIADLRAQLKARGKSGKRGATKKDLAKQIMQHDTLLALTAERKQNLLKGENRGRGIKMKIKEAGGFLKDVNYYGMNKEQWKAGQTVQAGLSKEQQDAALDLGWEAFVEESIAEDGTAIGIRFSEDGKPVNYLDETTNILQDKGGFQYEIRDVALDEEGGLIGGTGLFNNYQQSKKKADVKTTVDELRFEGPSPRIARPTDLVGGIMGHLKEWFAPSGPLGWEAFMLSRKRIGRIRAMEKMANQIGDEFNLAVAATVADSNNSITNPEQAEEMVMSALRRSMTRFQRTEEEIKALKEEKKTLKKEIKKQEAFIETSSLFQGGKNAKKLKDAKIELMMQKGDLEEINLMLNPNSKLKPTQAAYTLPEELRDSFLKIRGFVDMMSKRILKELPAPLLANEKGGKQLKSVIQENVGSYMTRSYRVFEPSGYNPLSWWNRTMPTNSAKIMRGKVAAVKELLKSRGDMTERQIDQEIRIIGQGLIGEGEQTLIGGVLSQTKPEQGTETAEIIDVTQKLLKRRRRIPKEVRALMGEITSPAEAAAVTTARLATLLENNRFWEQLKLLNDMPGQRLFSPVPLPAGPTEGKALTWFPQGAGLVHKVTSAGNNPFEGMYTTQSVADALAVQQGGWQSDRVNSSIWRNLVVAPKAYIQLGKIVLSPPAQIRNFLSAALFVLGNGHFTGFKDLPEAIKVVGSEMFEGGVDAQGRPTTSRQRAQETYRKLLDLGVLNTSVSLGDILGSWRMAGSGIFEQPGDFLGATAKPFKSMYTRAEQYYTAADDFWKVVAYGSELRAIKTQFKTEADLTQLLAHAKDLGMSYTINRQDLETAQQELAAFKVRQTIPNYDYVGKFAETLRTGPLAFLGNFIAFPTEIVRTSANIMTIAHAEIMSDNVALQKRGWSRFMGYGVSAFGIGTAAQAVGQALSDVDKEEIEASRFFLPYFSKNNLIIPIEKKIEKEGGGFDFIDGSYIMVYDDLARLVPTLMREFQLGKDEGRSSADSVTLAMTKTIGAFIEPFIEPAIYARAMVDVLQNRNSATGKPIWNEAEGRGLPLEGVGARNVATLNYFLEKAAPGFVPAVGKVVRGSREGAGAYGRFGNKQELGDAVSSFLGVKVNRVNPTSSLSFSLTSLLNEIDQAENIFMRQVYNKGPNSGEDLIRAYDAMQKSNYFINQELFRTFAAAEKLDMNKNKLREDKKRLSKKLRLSIERGENLPLKTRKQLLPLRKRFDDVTKTIEDAEGISSGRRFPLEELSDIYNVYRGLSLDSVVESRSVREDL